MSQVTNLTLSESRLIRAGSDLPCGPGNIFTGWACWGLSSQGPSSQGPPAQPQQCSPDQWGAESLVHAQDSPAATNSEAWRQATRRPLCLSLSEQDGALAVQSSLPSRSSDLRIIGISGPHITSTLRPQEIIWQPQPLPRAVT